MKQGLKTFSAYIYKSRKVHMYPHPAKLWLTVHITWNHLSSFATRLCWISSHNQQRNLASQYVNIYVPGISIFGTKYFKTLCPQIYHYWTPTNDFWNVCKSLSSNLLSISNQHAKYSWLSLSRPRLSRITAYLEVKILSLLKHEN